MKKVVLATITSEERKCIQERDRIYNTYRTLMLNQFISIEEKNDIINKQKKAYEDLQQIYNDIAIKYKFPFLLELNYKISSETNELFIEVM